MKNQRKLLFYARVTLFVLGTMAITGCKENEPVERSPVEQSTVVSVADLKQFMSELVNVEVKDISYDKTNDSFNMFGVKQITRAELTGFYLNSKK